MASWKTLHRIDRLCKTRKAALIQAASPAILAVLHIGSAGVSGLQPEPVPQEQHQTRARRLSAHGFHGHRDCKLCLPGV